ncbi:MAG: glycosyltransferase [Rhodospirillaceae bacterium]|jgi:glycosyltransferase involved in cell wall biosynthesis|nr:glycosyltransferase [Rhodospirillaceae bacterium]MBT6117923.1 glycosyltransferase [Rhodospirillaceae bacterium]
MRILHVISSLDPALGGPSFACTAMARAVAAKGHRVAIYTTDFGQEGVVPATGEAVVAEGVATHVFPVRHPKAWKRSPALARALRCDLAGFDLVHLHSLYLYHDWVTGDLCRAGGVPYIVRPHGTLDPYLRRRRRFLKAVLDRLFQDRVLRDAAAIHYTAEEEMRLAAGHDGGAPGVVVPLGLDPGTAAGGDAAAFRARYPETADRPIVLFLSRLHEKKGLDLLIPAVARLAEARDLHLVLAGPDGGAAKAAEAMLAAEGLTGRATVTGMLEGPAKRDAYAAATLFALPSYSENFGIVVVEAMAAGLPVLISDRVNIWREVAAAEAGRVVSCGVDAVAEALAGLIDDPEAARAMGEKGRALVADRFAWDRVADALIALYESVASSARATK